jgi:hypothetical protein
MRLLDFGVRRHRPHLSRLASDAAVPDGLRRKRDNSGGEGDTEHQNPFRRYSQAF